MSSKQGKHSKKSNKKENKLVAFFGRLVARFMAFSLLKKTICIALAVIILVAACLVAPMGMDIIHILSKWSGENYQQIEDPDIMEVAPINEKIVNIALFGIDTRADSGDAIFSGNSDSIMILSLNTETGKIKLMSVMRDSYLPIVTDKNKDGSYKTYNYKVNNAYASGGPERAIKTLNYNFGLDIKHYATVNFQGMAEIIDAVGGIEIDVLEAEIYTGDINHIIREHANIAGLSSKETEKMFVTKAGPQTLNGIQAVAWARIRSVATSDGVSNDYGRTDRQRTVMEKLLNKALDMRVTDYPDFIKKILPYMRTSVSPAYAASLATAVLTKSVSFEQTRLPNLKYIITDNIYTEAGSSVYYDPTDAKAVIHAFIYDDINPDEFLKTYTPLKNNWAGLSLGGSGSNKPTNNPNVSNPENSGGEDLNPETPDGENQGGEVSEPQNPDENQGDENGETGDGTDTPVTPPEGGETIEET